MRKVNVFKVLIKILCIVFCFFVVFNNYSFAAKESVSDIIGTINGTGYGKTGTGVVDSTKNIVGTIIQVIRIVGMGVAIIMLIYIAIKYMSAAPQEKAEFKKQATGFIVGAIVLFGTSAILGLIQDFAEKNIEL